MDSLETLRNIVDNIDEKFIATILITLAPFIIRRKKDKKIKRFTGKKTNVREKEIRTKKSEEKRRIEKEERIEKIFSKKDKLKKENNKKTAKSNKNINNKVNYNIDEKKLDDTIKSLKTVKSDIKKGEIKDYIYDDIKYKFDSDDLKKAIIYSEILGKPVSLRR